MSNRPSSKGRSGEHPAVKAYRDKLDSIQENTVPELLDLLAKADRLSQAVTPSPRREPEDEVPVDTELEDEPEKES